MVLSLVKVTVLGGFTGYHQRGMKRWPWTLSGESGVVTCGLVWDQKKRETRVDGDCFRDALNTTFMHLCSLTLSESAPSSLLPDFQPVLPIRPLGLQTGAPAATPFPQIATVRHFPLPALPSGRGALHAHW